MAGSGAAKIDDDFMRKGVLRCIEKPFKIKEIASLIIGGLDLVDEGATRNGIALSGFLALIEMEQLSCLLKIKSATTDSGLLYFERGIIWGGSFRELDPEEAAIEMLSWDKVEITFLALPKKKYERRIFSNLKTLIEKARQRKEKIEINKNLTIPENEIKVVDDPGRDQVEQEFFIELKPGQQEKVEEKLSELKRLKGFISLCVFSPGGEIVTGIYDQSEEFEQMGDVMFDMVGKAQKIFKNLKLGSCDIIDITGDDGRHLLVKSYHRYNINYIVVLICRGDAETEIFKHYLGLTVPALVDYLKIR
jgi:predicted regulator of Ras-like GTPase activity (Roadblock/LC7/MglB family)